MLGSRYACFAILFLALSATGSFGQTDIITTYAGPQLPVNGALAVSQAIDNPRAALDGAGGFYIASLSQNRVYRVDSSGNMRLAAGTGSPGFSGDGGPATLAQLYRPSAITVDNAGNLYISDAYNYRIRKVTPVGIISTVAGNGTSGNSGDGGPATEAMLGISYGGGVAVDSIGNLYIADTTHNRIRKVTSDGIICTVAGTGTGLGSIGYSGDGGPATAAQLGNPYGLAVDSAGNLYIADSGNNRVRKVTSDGIIRTVAGTGTGWGSTGYGGDGGKATEAKLSSPTGVAVDSIGNLYIADSMNHCIRKVTTDGIIRTVAGNGSNGYGGDGVPAIAANLYQPLGVDVDSTGNLFIADTGNSRIRKVTTDGIINTIAGNGTLGYSGDGGPATAAKFTFPMGVAVAPSGDLYIVDRSNERIRKITPAGIISTIAGNGTMGFLGDGGPATSAQFYYPHGIAIDAAGNLYVTEEGGNRIRKITTAGMISTVAGTGTYGAGGDGGRATAAQLASPYGVAVDSAGNLYIADYGNYRIRKVTAAGIISTVAGTGTKGYSGDGGPATAAQISYPHGVAVDAAGNIYIADFENCRIRKVTSNGVISTVAGSGAYGYSGDGGPAAAAALRPEGVSIDSDNNLLIVDSASYAIRKVTADGVIRTIAGNGINGFSGDNGPATAAQLNPYGVAADSAGNLFIADTGNNRIRKVVNLACTSSTLNSGGAAVCQTPGATVAARTGYAKLSIDSGIAPYGTAVFRLKQNGVTVTEAGVPVTPPATQARIFIDYRTGVNAIPGRSSSGSVDINTGLAVVNYGTVKANVVYTLRDANGATVATGHGTIATGNHISCFIGQLKDKAASDFNLPANFQSSIQFGTLDIVSDQAISVVALRGINNQRKEFLLTTTPVADLTNPISYSSIFFPQFADGGGYSTSLILLNTSDQAESGTLRILDNNGMPLIVHQAGGTTNSSFLYAIPAGGVFRFQTDGLSTDAKAGWVKLTPGYLRPTPVGLGLFTYNPDGVLVSESGIPSAAPTTHARIFMDLSTNHNTGLAIANLDDSGSTVTLKAFQMDGVTAAGTIQGPLALAANGHDSKFVNQFINGLPSGFQGVLDISSASPFAALTVRSLINERDEFLISTFPTADANQAAPAPIIFPQVADGSGYVTQFILISAGDKTSTTFNFYDEAGAKADFTK
jgi:sugar lactone lactonase YvrE